MTGIIATAEATLCRIFAEVLGLGLVRPDVAFFDAGGDSVLALQVVARAREAGLALSVRDLFDHQTPQTLAAVTGDLADPATSGGAAAPAESPLLTFSGEEFEEFEDTELDQFGDAGLAQQVSDTDAGWETVT